MICFRYRSVFGTDYFSFWCGGVLFVVINSQYYFDGSKIPEIVQEQETWLDKQLTLAKSSKHSAVIFQHIPPFVKMPNESDSGYFALPLISREPLLEKLYCAGMYNFFLNNRCCEQASRPLSNLFFYSNSTIIMKLVVYHL